jgi:glucosamine 6-phosphate synthetase-like amidotransferase/phosphosugar isomerase protein
LLTSAEYAEARERICGSEDDRLDVCGIAGYSLGNGSEVNRTLAAQALLAGIAERGADAVGYAYREGTSVSVHKQQTGASALLDGVALPPSTDEVLVHVRDYTKGHPAILANNHPIRHGRVVGIHNGVIANDDELFAQHGLEREEPEMTVDSEAIFALVDAFGASAETLEQLVGAMAAAWVDEREPGELHLARGVGRPLWIARGRHEVFFASTRSALEIAEHALGATFLKSQVDEGRLLTLAGGSVTDTRRWTPDASYQEDRSLPAVRAPHEGRSCLALLSALVAPA